MAEVAGPGYAVDALGGGVYLFRWQAGFYLSPFVVGDVGVTAFDPINDTAARAYRAAIAAVTPLPVRRLVYSHDHRDHICGGGALASDCEVCAHANAATRIAQRGDRDVIAPTRLLGDGATIVEGDVAIDVHDFGPNHSDSNLLFRVPTKKGRMLVWVDGVEPGVAPYRNLPDTNFAGYLSALERAAQLDFEFVIGGHTGPGARNWVDDYREYLLRLLDSTAAAFQASGGQVPRPEEDGVAMTERVRGEVCVAGAAGLRGRFGHWGGFEAWAPQTADRILSYLITGN